MGDRANIVLKNGDNFVWLYSHWGGGAIPSILQTALAKHWRWDDPNYLARIIFCKMVAGVETYETGFGISAEPCDGDDRILLVDTNAQTVSRGHLPDDSPDMTGFVISHTWTLEDFVDLPEKAIDAVWSM